MSTKQRMKRIGGISLIVGALLLGLLPSCGKKETTATGGSKTFVEKIKPISQDLLPFLDSYTSGVIAYGEPVVVRFSNPAEMKVKYWQKL